MSGTESTGFEPAPDLPLPGMPEPPVTEVAPPGVTRWRPRMTVEAVQLTSDADWEAIARWCSGKLGKEGTRDDPMPAIRVWTGTGYGGRGFVWATAGNWIVKGFPAHGSQAFMVWDAALFAETYEAVTDSAEGMEPWPDWLENLTPEQRAQAIIDAVAACYEDRSCYEPGDHERAGERHCTALPAYLLVLRLLAEAGDAVGADGLQAVQAVQPEQQSAGGAGSPAPACVPLGARIRSARESAGLTQEALAGKLGVTQTAVSYWEAGKRDPGIGDLTALAEALGVTAASLLSEGGAQAAGAFPPPVTSFGQVDLELMGHRYRVGTLTEVVIAGQPFLRLEARDGKAEFYRPDAVYCITPVTEAAPEPRALPPGAGFGLDLTEDDGDPWGTGDGGPF